MELGSTLALLLTCFLFVCVCFFAAHLLFICVCLFLCQIAALSTPGRPGHGLCDLTPVPCWLDSAHSSVKLRNDSVGLILRAARLT